MKKPILLFALFVTMFTSKVAIAALPLKQSNVVGIYKGMLPAATCCGQDITLYLNVDKTAKLVTDFLNGEPPIIEIGIWKANDDEAQMSVTLTGQENRPYDSPGVMAFEYKDDTLTIVEGEEIYNSLGLGLVRFEALALNLRSLPYDVAIAAQLIRDRGFVGIYKGMLPAATCCGQDITLYLNVDKTAKLVTDFLNGEPPIIQLGTWEAPNERGIILTMTGQKDRAYETPNVLQFELVEGVLTATEDEDAYGSVGLLLRYFDAIVSVNLSSLE